MYAIKLYHCIINRHINIYILYWIFSNFISYDMYHYSSRHVQLKIRGFDQKTVLGAGLRGKMYLGSPKTVLNINFWTTRPHHPFLQIVSIQYAFPKKQTT